MAETISRRTVEHPTLAPMMIEVSAKDRKISYCKKSHMQQFVIDSLVLTDWRQSHTG